MGFHFTAAGTVDEVRDQVRHATQSGQDPTQLEAVRHLVFGELDAWPRSPRSGYDAGVLIEVRGSDNPTLRYLNLTIRPLLLPKPGSDARPDESGH